VSGRQSGGDLRADAQRGQRIELPLCAKPLAQGVPRHKLHHDERQIDVLFNRVDRHDVRMIDCRRRAGLTDKPPSRCRIGRQRAIQDLDRNRTPQTLVTSLEQHAHAAVPDCP
jgi:hypothetical protein